MKSLQNDAAFALAKVVVGMVAPCLREEEQRELFEMVYTAAKDALARYEEKADRRMKRLSAN
jgi:DNA-binding protein YbaB